MSVTRTKPQLVTRPDYSSAASRWGLISDIEVADFSEEARPAYRVECHCRNCHWRGEARFPVGEKIPLWLLCPKCETRELSAHGDFIRRDEVSREEEKRRANEYAAGIRSRMNERAAVEA